MSLIEPLVSVITATYNWSSVLQYSISSVLKQEFEDFELIIVGDCCTDNTAEVVYSFQDPRIKWINLDENSGSQSKPNNTGIQNARGKYIAYLGHDDLWMPNHLSTLVSGIGNATMAYNMTLCIGPDDENTDYKNLRKIIGTPNEHTKQTMAVPSSMMHLKNMPVFWRSFEDLTRPPDQHFLLETWQAGKIISLKNLTVLKFNSAWRRDSYINKPCHQQQSYFDKMSDVDLLLLSEIKTVMEQWHSPLPCHIQCGKKALDFMLVFMRDHPNVIKEIDKEKEPGWYVKKSRTYRGLDK